jgi:hypothetical protein
MPTEKSGTLDVWNSDSPLEKVGDNALLTVCLTMTDFFCMMCTANHWTRRSAVCCSPFIALSVGRNRQQEMQN